MLKDEIKKLIREGYLRDYVRNRGARPQNDQNEARPHREIRTIFGGPHFTEETRGAQNCYLREAKERLVMTTSSLDKRPAKQIRGEVEDITFSEKDARHVRHSHCDTLVIKAMIANNNVHWILVDNGSSVDILYFQAFERMGLKVSNLKPSPNPIYGFTGDSVVPLGVISLPMTLGEYPRQSCVIADFLVIDQSSAFNVILGRPSLRELRAITSIHHLFMKFPMPQGVGKVKGDQQESRQCYHQAVKAASKLRQFHVVNQWPPSEGPFDDIIDPRSRDEEGTTGPIEDLVDFQVSDKEPSKVLKIGKNVPDGTREAISEFLRQNLDVFAWAHSDMERIDPSTMSHRLSVDPNRKLVRLKRRAINTESYQGLKEEIDKLLSNDFIKESFYPSWLANPVLVKKPNDRWRTFLDFTDLNKACPKDSFPLPRIDQLVDATSGHELLSFMDAYSRYNQIPMHVSDQEHTSFIIDHELYCYKVMPFGLKNAGVT